MEIRKMMEEDYDQVDKLMGQVHELHLKNRPDLYTDVEHVYSLREYQDMIQNDGVISILAEENNKVLGICFVSMRSRTCMVKRLTAYMDDLCVDQEYRGRGIGKQLFRYAEFLAKEKGAERLDLMVWAFNDHAKAFYESLGLKPQRYIYEKQL